MKKVISLVCAAVITLGFVGCGSGNKTVNNSAKNTVVNEAKEVNKKSDETLKEEAEIKWTIAVEGVKDETIDFSNLDIEKLNTLELDAVQKKKDGSTKEQQWEGVLVKDVFEQLGIENYTSAVFEASDGYSKEVTADIINDEGTIIGLKLDGEELSEKRLPAELVIKSKSSNWWVRNLSKITIKK